MALVVVLIDACSQAGRLTEANAALEELRSIASQPVTVDHAEIKVRSAEGDHERVLELVRGMPAEPTLDDTMMMTGRDQLSTYEIVSLSRTGRSAGAAELVRTCLRRGELPIALLGVSTVFTAVGSDITEVAGLFPRARLRRLLHAAGQAPIPLADALAEALWQRYPGGVALLGFASWIGDRLPLMRALEWSARLRQHGLADRCALLAVAAAGHRPVRDRVVAAAVAVEMYADQSAMPLLTAALELVGDEQAEGVLAELRTLAPGIAAAIEPAPAR